MPRKKSSYSSGSAQAGLSSSQVLEILFPEQMGVASRTAAGPQPEERREGLSERWLAWLGLRSE